jgi:hypothetical protein
MNLSSDLMGLGVSPLVALRTSNGGSGPITGTTSSTSTTFALAVANGNQIRSSQYFISITSVVNTTGLAIPPIGETGALLADDYVINNAGTTSLQIFASSGVIISTGGTNTSSTTIAQHTTMTLYPVSTTQWVAVKGS